VLIVSRTRPSPIYIEYFAVICRASRREEEGPATSSTEAGLPEDFAAILQIPSLLSASAAMSVGYHLELLHWLER
jgi:hypothetical protein